MRSGFLAQRRGRLPERAGRPGTGSCGSSRCHSEPLRTAVAAVPCPCPPPERGVEALTQGGVPSSVPSSPSRGPRGDQTLIVPRKNLTHTSAGAAALASAKKDHVT